MQILIVEDEGLIAEDLQETLFQLGYQGALVASSGEAALEVVAARRPDLVLMDIHLPGALDGVAAAEQIRRHYAIPVVYLTAYADPDTVQRAKATEPYGYILKPFDELDLRIGLELAFAKHQAEIALRRGHAALEQSNARLTEALAELEHRTAEIDVLSRLGGNLLRCSTLPEAHAVIMGATRQLFPGSAGALYVRRNSAALIEPVAVWGGYTATPPFDPGSLGPTPDHQTTVVRPRPECSCPLPDCADNHLCIPLVAEQALLGLLRVRTESGLNLAVERLAVALAEQAALGLANVLMREGLREQALRDPLTGLFNRRYMEETLKRELARAARSQYPIGVILFDIDHFKRVNDSYGHAAGDTLLRVFSRLLLRAVRSEDIACRYGGEEFVLILPSAPLPVTMARAELIRARISCLRVRHDQQDLGSITVSAGVAIINDSTTSVTQALAQADAALYRAKRGGRNRVENA